MGNEKTAIEWADYTANAWWGCVMRKLPSGTIDPACVHCYAKDWDKRFAGAADAHWGADAPRKPQVESFARKLRAAMREAEKVGRPQTVFMMSMGDWAEDHPDLVEPRKRMFHELHKACETGLVIPLMLSKREDRVGPLLKELGMPKGAWIGMSAVDQETVDLRVPELLKVEGAAGRFLSMEPLRGPVDIHPYLDPFGAACCGGGGPGCPHQSGVCSLDTWPSDEWGYSSLDWIIAGGESGPKARPSHPDWYRSLRDQCAAAGVPYFFKQWGEWAPSHGKPVSRDDRMGVFEEDGAWLPDVMPSFSDMISEYHMKWYGKKAAGSLLDGVDHKAFPVAFRREVSRGA